MINKYQFIFSGKDETTIASIFVSGDYLAPYSASTSNEIIDFQLSWANYDASNNKITSFYPYDGKGNYSRRLSNNNFGFVKSGAPIITGYTITQNLLSLYSQEAKNNFSEKTSNAVHLISGSSIMVGIQFEDVFKNDTFVNINLKRNYDSLDTLTIKNNVLGQWNTVNSPTGVIFGTLLSTQKLKDENGEFIKIPLRNVPIIVFSKTNSNVSPINLEQYSRLPLNMIQNSLKENYTNDFAYNFDQQILPNITTKKVTETYQYSTLTNENGEYILKDVPTGLQTLIFEIDLLKQGLTQEEVELNVSPYPKTNNLTTDQVPHLIYREIPVEVLPSWGTVNTGYTNCDINIAVDLRKWTTYFVPPVTAYDKTYDEILKAGFQPNLSIRVRDMANKGIDGTTLFPNTNIECVNIPDITKRDYSRLLGWTNEVRQLRDLIVFNQLQFNVFKLPANIYDPNGYKTDGSGNTINNKGVWLSSYQFKMFLTNEDSFYRETGFNLVITDSNNGKLNLNSTNNISGLNSLSGNSLRLNVDGIQTTYSNYDLNNFQGASGITVGIFPYEKPWSIDYPIKYSIPKLPSQFNSLKAYSGNSPINMLIPKYLDGDRVGSETKIQVNTSDINFGGWGVQTNYAGDIYPNYFAQQVTTSEMYRYEAAINTFDEFSNGYTPNLNYGFIPSGQTSQVKNGEIYQRVECGHAYFIWTQGYPRLINLLDYDSMYTADFLPEAESVNQYPGQIKPLFNNYLLDNNLFNNDTLLATDFVQIPEIQKGYIYLYKIVNPDPNLLVSSQPPLQKRGAKLSFRNIYMQRGGVNEKSRAVPSSVDANHRFMFNDFALEPDDTKSKAVLRIANKGITTVEVTVGTKTEKIQPNANGNSYFDFPLLEANGATITLPTNDNFDYAINTYYDLNYGISIHNLQFYFPNGNKSIFVQDVSPNFSINDGTTSFQDIKISGKTTLEGLETYYLVSRLSDIRVRGPQFNAPPAFPSPNPNGLLVDWGVGRHVTADIQGLILESSDITYVDSYEFRLNDITPETSNKPILPYKVV